MTRRRPIPNMRVIAREFFLYSIRDCSLLRATLLIADIVNSRVVRLAVVASLIVLRHKQPARRLDVPATRRADQFTLTPELRPCRDPPLVSAQPRHLVPRHRHDPDLVKCLRVRPQRPALFHIRFIFHSRSSRFPRLERHLFNKVCPLVVVPDRWGLHFLADREFPTADPVCGSTRP